MKKNFLSILEFIIYSLLLYFFTFIIQKDNLYVGIMHLADIIRLEVKYIIVGYLILFSLLIIGKSILRNKYISNIVVTIIVLVITIISYYKRKFVQPFVPSDLFLIRNLKQISRFGLNHMSLSITLICLVILCLAYLQYLLYKKNYIKKDISLKNDWYRIPLFIFGIIMIYNLCISPYRFEKLGLKSDIGDNYDWMGGNATFFLHLGDYYYAKPEQYNKDCIEALKKEYENSNQKEPTDSSDISPNVIIIMNESFSDPNKIDNITYSIDPISSINKLAENYSNCKLIETVSPVIGGSTSLPEYELLTGLTSNFIPKQIFPYTCYIKGNMNSIVRTFKNNNYTTIGIHTNTKTFYNRIDIWNYLGFEKTVFSEDINNAEIKGGNISENELANQIIKAYEENNGNKFIFGLTMQNHMPYLNKEYLEYNVKIDTDDYTNDELIELQNYVQGIYDGDQMYSKLVDYFKKTAEPTILVMFGDHLPALSEYSIYKKSKYTELEYYLTPCIIWANYDIDYGDLFYDKISPSTLALNILKLSNIEIPWYFIPFEKLYERFPVINNNFVINKKGEILGNDEIDTYDLVNDCKIINYDLLFSKKYIPIK